MLTLRNSLGSLFFGNLQIDFAVFRLEFLRLGFLGYMLDYVSDFNVDNSSVRHVLLDAVGKFA